jgi:HAD-hyrolase-like
VIAFVTLDFRQTLFADTRDSLRQAHILRLEGVRCMLSEADPGAGAAAFSDEMGVRKPAAEIFHRVLDQTGVGPAVAVHVGDDPVTDVAGARGVGMRAIHYALWSYPASSPGCPDRNPGRARLRAWVPVVTMASRPPLRSPWGEMASSGRRPGYDKTPWVSPRVAVRPAAALKGGNCPWTCPS